MVKTLRNLAWGEIINTLILVPQPVKVDKGMLKLELLVEQLKFATARYLLANFEAIKLLDGMLPVPFRTSELSQLARYSRASGHTPINQACSTFHKL